MASVKVSGLASGLPPNLVDQLVQIERIPIQSMEMKKAKTENRLNLVTELEGHLRDIRGSLGDLASAKGFNALTVDSADPSIITGVVEPGSGAKGSWNVEVLELASKSAALSNGFPDKDESQVGIGYLSFDTSEGEKEVFIDASNNTLEGVARQINSSGLGVRASVIQDRKLGDEPYRLLISGIGYGDDDYVDFPTLYFLDGDQDFYIDRDLEAKNARVNIDGFEFELPENQLNDLADGLTLDLRQAAPGKVVNIKVQEDSEAVVGKVDSFVESVNKVLNFIQKQNKLTSESDTTSTLGGDSMLRTIESDFRRMIQDPVFGRGGRIKRLAELGIQFNRQGTLDWKKESFEKALKTNPDDVRDFLVGDGFSTGFVNKINRKVALYFDGAFGLISNRKRNLQTQMRQMDDRIDSIERRVEQKEKALRRKFANLEEKMASLKNQGNFLAARLGGGGAAPINLSGATVSNS